MHAYLYIHIHMFDSHVSAFAAVFCFYLELAISAVYENGFRLGRGSFLCLGRENAP